jgi:hypothetical protein
MSVPSDEKTYGEIPFIEQLKGLEWEHIEGEWCRRKSRGLSGLGRPSSSI